MIKRVVFKFLTLPVKLILVIRDFFFYILKSLHLSIRRKIAFDYLMIYSVVSLISLFFVPIIFVFFEIESDVDQNSAIFNQMFVAYNNEIYSNEELENKFQQLTESSSISYQVKIYSNTDEKLLNTVSSGKFHELEYPKNPLERLLLFKDDGVIAKYIGPTLLKNSNGQKTFILRAFYPFDVFEHELLTLCLIMLIFFSVGFFFMTMLGKARVKSVLNPIYYMTKTAEQVSISNLDLRLDVETTKYELKDLAMTINSMLDRLDKDYSKQKRFVSDVSHELRTPISIINGYASMLERWGKEDEEILNESIEAIISESKNMQSLVENLLTLVRSDNQTLKYEPSIFDIGKLICDVVKEFNMVNTKDQYITCDSREDIMVLLDEAKIKQTLRIFVDNAVKYTPNNGAIQVKCYPADDAVVIHIKDTGIGISKQDLPFLFERFYRSDESRTRQTGGHGLGLSIAKVIIIGHSGKIKVKSRIGRGSEFIITLPNKIEAIKKADE